MKLLTSNLLFCLLAFCSVDVKAQLILNPYSHGSSATVFEDVWGWWRADEISGTSGSYTLADKSGNGRTMTQSAGTITTGTATNGQAKLTGNATARFTSLASLESWPITIITVGRRTSGTASGFFGHTGPTGYNTLWMGYEASNSFRIYNSNSTANATTDAGTDACWVGRIGYGSRVSIVNGIIQPDMGLAPIVRSSAVLVTLGTEYRGLNFDWYETLVWNRTLTLDELDEVHTYINQRYGMTIPLWSSYSLVDAIWLGGQSNAAGRGDRGASDVNIPAEYDAVLTGANVWYGTPASNIGTAWETLNINNNNHDLRDEQGATYIGPEVSMCKDYIDRTGGSVYLMKFALGGSYLNYHNTTSSFWDPLNNSLIQSSEFRLYAQSMLNWWKSLAAHQAASRKPNMKGLVWYQGEQDATVEAYANSYATNGENLFTELRKELGVGNAKAFIVRIHSGIGVVAQPYRDNVRAQQDALAGSLTNAVLVDVDGYTLRDDAHINVNGQLSLGTSLADDL